MPPLLLSFLIGLAAGGFGGLVGLGGGIVMIPLMVSFAGLRQQQAHGTSLVAVVVTGIAGAVTYASRGSVDLVAAACLGLPAVATARLGARHAHALPEWQLKRAFGAFLVFVVAVLLAKSYLVGFADPATGGWKVAILVVAGAATGFLSGMMGVGGGSLMVPAMVLLTGFPQLLAQGSSLLAMIPAGAAGAHKHWQLGNVVRRLLPGLVPGILLGTWAGGTFAMLLTDGTLRTAFGIVVGYSGVKFLRTPRPRAAVEIA
jgi:uncharacterized membrane protein YfcA